MNTKKPGKAQKNGATERINESYERRNCSNKKAPLRDYAGYRISQATEIEKDSSTKSTKKK